MPKFRFKNALFGHFWSRTLKNYCHIWYQHPEICLIVKFVWKKKSLNLGPKSPIGYFWRRTSYLGIFEISTLKFVYMQNFSKKTKTPKVWSKNALFGYFSARVLKNCCHNWNQHPHFFQIGKFCGKSKMPKFGSKNVLFGHFWARILKISYLCIFRLEF